MTRYLIGIDLGTTNSALAYLDLRHPRRGDRPDIKPFAIPQLVAPGEIKERPLLPSFLYLPGQHDLPPGATALPWDARRDWAVGEFARNHGGKVPGRLVSSAKSWLCHGGVDRSAGLLPWTAPPDVPRVSPIEASARYLRHMVESWNHVMAKDRPDDRLEKQTVVLTVPASFDDVARNLTVEAARKAGLEELILLEEPQAAFYCWQMTHSASASGVASAPRDALKPGMRCLVVDVGGGTSDFSLIEAVEQQGELGFVRQAVGDHLLLGGDNMDLALAKFVETKLPGAGRLDAVQYGLLTQACRLAKETLLGPNPPASTTVTVIGRGRAVIGGTLHAPLTPADVRQVVLDGFFPVVPADASPQRGARAGLHEMGLPYVSDAAITRHLAAFLKNQTARGDAAPAAILFNGGVFQPASLRERVVEVLRHWYERTGHPWRPLVLTNPSLDLAVSWGAAYYAWLRHTGGRRIGGGIARSYYIGVQPAQSAGERGCVSAPRQQVVCVVPQHMEEGQDIVLDKPELELALGQPVMFPLYTSTVRGDDKAGDLLAVAPDQLLRMPPLHTVLRGGKRSGTKSVPVILAARSTAIGTLELFCVARDGNNRWRLEFNIRDLVQETPNREEGDGQTEQTLTDVWPEAQVQEAAQRIRAVYADSELTPRELTKALEAELEAPRHAWPTGLCRRLWEFLAEVADERRRSPSHLSRWYNLAGYCLRPGFGDPLDKFRIEQLWKMMAAPPRADAGKGGRGAAPHLTETGADAWIMWRRVAGGLHSTLQQALYDRLRPVLLPAKGKAIARPGANELAEMWRAAAAFERLDVKHKEALGAALLKPLRRSPVPTYGFWALTRLGARTLLYGPLNAVVHHQVVEKWLESILPFEPGNQSERLAWAFCLSQLARRTGQRALDIDDKHRENVLRVLRGQSVPAHWARMVEEVSEMEQEEQGQMLGDSLPIGLRLLQPRE
ncbi:MAG TPA: Hsp70 family protein [Gemmataceae bacterium]|jgi:molecular chaperone DnaK (HSP70)